MSENDLRNFGSTIQRLIKKENLTKDEAYDCFVEVLKNRQPDLQQGAFLAALVSKGETIEELVGAWAAIVDVDTVSVSSDLPEILVENSGTGMDSLKTFNVSSAAAVVAAACGATMVRHGARALTSFCGTVDILERVGLDVECQVKTIENSIIKEGIGLFNGMSPLIHPSALGRILSQIRFGSTLNIAASLANPARPTHGLRGVYSAALIPSVAKLMAQIGYKRGLVVHGRDDKLDGGMDEISITGETIMQEFSEAGLSSMTLRPEDVGLKTAVFADIATTGNIEQESIRFLEVLSGSGHGACIDFTCLNAGAVLYISGIVADIETGVQRSRDAIMSGAAIDKLQKWIVTQSEDASKSAAVFKRLKW